MTQARLRNFVNGRYTDPCEGGYSEVVDPSTGACDGGDSSINCQFGNSGRNNYRGPHFTYSEMYVTRKVAIAEHVTFRFDTQVFNLFNHPNFAPPSGTTVISMFAYENPAIDSLLEQWRDSRTPITLLVPEGRISGAVARFFGLPDFRAGAKATSGSLSA